jgi:hypothetical protein
VPKLLLDKMMQIAALSAGADLVDVDLRLLPPDRAIIVGTLRGERGGPIEFEIKIGAREGSPLITPLRLIAPAHLIPDGPDRAKQRLARASSEKLDQYLGSGVVLRGVHVQSQWIVLDLEDIS